MTKHHLEMLAKHGPCPLHRRVSRPCGFTLKMINIFIMKDNIIDVRKEEIKVNVDGKEFDYCRKSGKIADD